jgi:hypothetical protein
MWERATFKSILLISEFTIQCLLRLFGPSSGGRWARFDPYIECILRCSCCCTCRSTGSCRSQPFLRFTCPCCGVRMLFGDLRSLSQQHFTELGESSESERSLLVLLPSPSVVGALAPAIEASFHSAASALRVIERSGSRSPARSLSQGSGASRQETAQRANKLLAEHRG